MEEYKETEIIETEPTMTVEIILDSDNSREVECTRVQVVEGMLHVFSGDDVIEMWNLQSIMGVINHLDSKQTN